VRRHREARELPAQETLITHFVLIGVRSAAYSLRASRFDAVEKRVLRQVSIYPRSSMSCAAVRLRTRFIVFADHGAHSRRVVNTRPTAR
jgi:hypothetical protein